MMADKNYFPQHKEYYPAEEKGKKEVLHGPQIYGYIIPGLKDHEGYIKVGYTDRTAEERIKEQTHAAAVKWKIVFTEPAVKNDGTVITDKQIHRKLKKKGYLNLNYGEDRNEWFKCPLATILAMITELRTGQRLEGGTLSNFFHAS